MGNEQSKSKELQKNGKIPEKHDAGLANGISTNITANGKEVNVNTEAVIKQNGGPHSAELSQESYVVVDSVCQGAHTPVTSESQPNPTIQMEEVKKVKEEKPPHFGIMFKKNDGSSAEKKGTVNADQTDASPPVASPQPETANLKQESESLTVPESATRDPDPEEEKAPESSSGNTEPVENQKEKDPEQNPVMNFFKTLVTPTKTPKKETAAPDATKDQSEKESQPATTTTVAQVSEPPPAAKGMSIPPPPPPEPPKMEIKGEPAAKPVKATPKEEPKAAAKEPEASKGKSAKDTLSRFFRPKTIKETPEAAIEVEVQPVVEAQETPEEVPEPVVEVQNGNRAEPLEAAEEVAQLVVGEQMVEEVPQPEVEDKKVDPSKSSTLEAAPKPEPAPPVQEEKKPASKTSFLSRFKPKVLLDHMTTKVQAASTSGVRLLRRTAGVAAEPKKASPAPAAAAAATAETSQTAKAKEEPKAAAKSSEAAVDNKAASAASQAADDAASVPKKLEKRNSIQMFFKNLGQKRNSIDAGVQTEPVAAAPAAEKAK